VCSVEPSRVSVHEWRVGSCSQGRGLLSGCGIRMAAWDSAHLVTNGCRLRGLSAAPEKPAQTG